MALVTFFNLRQERQKEIIDTALREFALHDYETASLSAIIDALGLAKGSFYRYFKNKKALYLFLLDHAIQFRVEHDKKVFEHYNGDFAQRLTQNFAARIQFDLTHPVYSAFLYNASQAKNSEKQDDIHKLVLQKILAILLPIVEQQQLVGVLRSDIEASVIAFYIVQIQLSIYDYLEFTYKFRFRDHIRDRRPLFDLPDQDIQTTAHNFKTLLLNGIAA